MIKTIMKRIFSICLFLMSITIVAQQTNDEYFYYYKGKRILLPVDSSKLVLMTNSMPQSTFFQYKGLQLSGIYLPVQQNKK